MINASRQQTTTAATGDQRALDLLDGDERLQRNAPTEIPPCPSWCRLLPGHEYHGVVADGRTYLRVHIDVAQGDFDFGYVCQVEHNREGLVELQEPYIEMPSCRVSDPAEVSRHAVAWMNLADRLTAAQGRL